MEFYFGAATDVGISKKTNQDGVAARVLNTEYGEVAFGIICDGMGGLSSGELASATVIKAFIKWCENDLPQTIDKAFSPQNVREIWDKIILEQNTKLYKYGVDNNMQLGTTLIAFIAYNKEFFAVNVGDSRLYKISDSVEQISYDQSLVAREVRDGKLTPEQAEKDPRRNVLLQCIGATDNVSQEYYSGKITDANALLLCSDGFRHELSNYEMLQALRPEKLGTVEEMSKKLRELIDTVKKRNEKDNISALILKIID